MALIGHGTWPTKQQQDFMEGVAIGPRRRRNTSGTTKVRSSERKVGGVRGREGITDGAVDWQGKLYVSDISAKNMEGGPAGVRLWVLSGEGVSGGEGTRAGRWEAGGSLGTRGRGRRRRSAAKMNEKE